MKTRSDHEYQARVWMQKSLNSVLENEALARIEALLPGGYRYRIEEGSIHRTDGTVHHGWTASFGDTVDGSGWGVPHAFSTKIGATLGLLAILADGCIYPGCSTSFGQAQRIEAVRQEASHAAVNGTKH